MVNSIPEYVDLTAFPYDSKIIFACSHMSNTPNSRYVMSSGVCFLLCQ